MIIQVKHIRANTKMEFEQIKNDLIKDFNKFGIEYGIIESDHNSDKNGYVAEVNYTL